MIEVAEASIARLRDALESGETTAVELVSAYRTRIAAFDRSGPRLNAVCVDDPGATDAARASDERRRTGRVLGPLDGIPYTAKDSFLATGLQAAAGSPAFAGLTAQHDAFVIERLRAGGAVLLGLTTMPPMANGGMQRGLHGRAESPYDGDFLTAPFASGSSNGSGTATAASFAAFGLGAETWSSGRGPASYNALCACTPSRGVISVRGQWPLVPTSDVIVPHTRSVADLLEVLDVIVQEDPDVRGDLWRAQPWVPLPSLDEVRPPSYRALSRGPEALAGLRLGFPRLLLGLDPLVGTGVGIGGPTGRPIVVRDSIRALWRAACDDLALHGARLVGSDLPLVSNHEGDRAGAPTIRSRGFVPPAFLDAEVRDLAAWAMDDFLRANGDPAVPDLAGVDGALIAPPPPGALPDRYDGFGDDLATYPAWAREHPGARLEDLPAMEQGLAGLEWTRQADWDGWLDRLGLDAIVFPAVADVGEADADVDPAAAERAWRNGVWVANGNLAIRQLGVPTVTVPMGTMPDTGMPVGLTIAGRAYDDARLLEIASAFEAVRPRRTPPPRTPPLVERSGERPPVRRRP